MGCKDSLEIRETVDKARREAERINTELCDLGKNRVQIPNIRMKLSSVVRSTIQHGVIGGSESTLEESIRFNSHRPSSATMTNPKILRGSAEVVCYGYTIDPTGKRGCYEECPFYKE